MFFSAAPPQVSVKEKLLKSIHHWQKLDVSEVILSIIRDSYKIAFHSTPLPCHLKNNASAVEEGAFVGEAALDVLRDDRVEEVFPPPKILDPLSVSVQSSGRKRVYFGSKTH